MTAGIICAAGAIGLICGELGASAAYRIPLEIGTFDAPKCAGCGKKLRFYECIPLLSYVFSGGKRRCCGAKIPAARLYAPIACAAAWIACALMFYDDYPVYAALAAIECTLLAVVASIDASVKWIPDRLQIALALNGGLTFLSLTGADVFDNPVTWRERLIGAAVGGGFFLAVYLAAYLLLKREGMGFGDVKLAFAVGLFIGWKGMLIGLIAASVSASAILLILRAKTHAAKDTEYPFAPFLSVGFVLAIFVTDICVRAYMSLF